METSLRRHPAFTRFWSGETASVLAYQMLVLAVGWQIYQFTDSALSLGLVGLAHFLSQILFMLAAGHVADSYDRRKVAVLSQTVQCAVAAVLALGSHDGWLNSETLYICTFVIGSAQTFQSPSMRSMLPALVGENLLPRCIAWSGATRKAAVIIGPALGGFIYLLGAEAVYAISAALFAVAGAVIFGIRLFRHGVHREPVTLPFVFGGFSYIRGQPVILGAISLDLFATLLGGATALLPIYARDILHTGPWGLGLLRAAPAIGAVFASVYLVQSPLSRGVGRIMFASVATFGLATVVFGISQSLPLSLAALIIMGAGDMVSVVIRTSLIQLETPDKMRGRVSAVNSLFTGTSNQLGQFESGLTAAWWGTIPAVVIGGIGTLLVVILWMRLFPSLVTREVLGVRTL